MAIPLNDPPKPVPPDFDGRSPLHIDPNTVDGDVTALDSRAQRIIADVKDLADEALRVRDQHRTQIDDLRKTIAKTIAEYERRLLELNGPMAKSDTFPGGLRQRSDVMAEALRQIIAVADDIDSAIIVRLGRISTIAKEALR